MAEKNIFAYKRLLSLHIYIFHILIYYLGKNCTHLLHEKTNYCKMSTPAQI